MTLYVSKTSADQYLIIEERTGKTVALVYDDAAIANTLAAAPELLKACQYVGCIGGTTCCEETPCYVCCAINKATRE